MDVRPGAECRRRARYSRSGTDRRLTEGVVLADACVVLKGVVARRAAQPEHHRDAAIAVDLGWLLLDLDRVGAGRRIGRVAMSVSEDRTPTAPATASDLIMM